VPLFARLIPRDRPDADVVRDWWLLGIACVAVATATAITAFLAWR
jgi:hypothetical protein